MKVDRETVKNKITDPVMMRMKIYKTYSFYHVIIEVAIFVVGVDIFKISTTCFPSQF